jgi:glycosyltransferase involved in cell wall biosynthesis
MRFVWDYNERYLREKGKKPGLIGRFILSYLRLWDRLAADRPDYLIANSRYTQERIAKYYRRESKVIYPPVDINDKEQGTNDKENVKYQTQDAEYFLIVSRLSTYKKVDVAVEAFNKLGFPLVVIGEGEQKKHLEKIAKSNIKILGWQEDEALDEYYKNALAFIFSAEDDFGITPIEAMLRGVPVIAFRKGGALETVEEGITGEFFDVQTPEILADGVRRFMENKEKYDKNIIKARTEEFSEERFKREFEEYIKKIMTND